MSQSLVSNLIHLVYSTKHRIPSISPGIQPQLWAYQAGILKQWDSPAVVIGGVDDHVHALFSLSKNHALKKVVEEVKKASSRWMKTQSSGNRRFAWQRGYAGFSVSRSNLEKVAQYIENQRHHHRRMTFQAELRLLFQKHQIPFDERYVWD